MLKRQLIYAAALAAMWVLSIATSGYGYFIAALIMLIIPALSFAYALFIRDKISITVGEISKTLIRGGQIKVSVRVRNSSYLLISKIIVAVRYIYSNAVSDTLKTYDIFIDGESENVLEDVIRLINAGEMCIDTTDSFVYDPLMLFKFSIKNCDKKTILVMPVLNEPDYYMLHNQLEDNTDSTEYSKRKKGEDASEIFDIRNYVKGDPLNRVHWKLSAKEDELLIKESGMPISSSNCILIELHKPYNDNDRLNLNGVYEMAYAIGNLACMKEKVFKFAFYDAVSGSLRVIDILNSDEFQEAVRTVIKQETYDNNMALKSALASELSEIQRLFYITDKIDESIYELEEKSDITSFIYVVNNDSETGKITTFLRSILYNTDRDDIRWGLSNTKL